MAEKKVMNLITLLNGRDNLIDLGEKTGTRTLYQPRSDPEDGGYHQILFHELSLRGVSRENAMLTVHYDGQDFRTLIERALESWSWGVERDPDLYPDRQRGKPQQAGAPSPEQ